MSFFAELKRRNVIKVAAAYVIVGWLLLQVSDTLVPALHLPGWFHSGVAFILIIGFPIALIFAWAFEMTPEGIRKEKDVDREQSITPVTGQKLNLAIMGLLILAVGYFAFDKFVLDPGRDAAEIEAALQGAAEVQPAVAESGEPDRSIAVLPFVNMSDDAGNEYFSDGLSEELLNLLAKVPELRVAARTSSFSFKGQNIEIPEIAERLGVANVLEGSVRKAGNQIRITAQLIKADDGFHLWSETYDRELDNIFQIQDDIAAAVVDSLKVTLLGEAPTSTETDPEAYRLYLEGQYFAYQRTPEALNRATDLFKRSVKIDTSYAPAWAELAYAYLWSAGSGNMPIDEGNALADRAIEMALAADPDYGWTYYVNGISQNLNKFDFKKGIESYERAFELDPGNAMIRSTKAFTLAIQGNYEEAVSWMEDAVRVDPVIPELHTYLGGAYWSVNRFDDAIAAYRKALSLSPEYIGNRHRIARIQIQQGKLDEALETALSELDTIYRLTATSMAYFALGNIEASDEALAELIEKGSADAAYQIAQVYGMRDDADKAFEWLERAYQNRDSGAGNTMGDPSFFSLVDDPRFVAFLEKFGIAEYWRRLPSEWGGPTS
jgi:TolB-like protein